MDNSPGGSTHQINARECAAARFYKGYVPAKKIGDCGESRQPAIA